MPENLDPRNSEFWRREYDDALREVSPIVIAIYTQASIQAAQQLPPFAQILIDWDTYNQYALDWLSTWGRNYLSGITQTSSKQVMRAIEDWVKAGEHLDKLTEHIGRILEPIYADHRARQIAVTETTRIYAEGNLAAWRASGVVTHKRWMTGRDELVCPYCAPLDGMVVELDSNGFTTEIGGLGVTAPPLHPNCRCWLTPVLDPDLLEDIIANED
jgi:SPP1 gp7 family putative phage head morphogenesis protein